MNESEQPDEGKQKAEAANAEVTQPIGPPPQQPPAISNTGGAGDNPQPPQPILVRLVGGDDLEPFEEQTLAISRETLEISRRTERIAILGFLIALAAAVFVAVQVFEMTKQTQIFGSQTESAVASATQGERDTRTQLRIAQQQVKAAQDSADAIKMQMRTQQRAWLQVTSTPPPLPDNSPIKVPIAIENIGSTPARHIYGFIVVTVHKRNEVPQFVYTKGHARYRIATGSIFPRKAIGLSYEAIRHGEKQPEVIIFDSALKKAVGDGDAYIVAHGYIRYTDVFKGNHWVTFCDVMLADSKVYNSTKAYEQCVAHNDVDPN